MQPSTIGKYAAGVAAFGLGASAAVIATRGKDPWTWDINGPGSIEQVPSILVPWCLPALGAAAGATALTQHGNPKAALAVGLGAVALYGAGFTTWVVGVGDFYPES